MSEQRSSATRSTSARERALFLSLALVLSLAAAVPLVAGAGMVNTRAGGDSAFLLQRVQQLTENLRAGVVPARWMADGAHGLGYPFYNFYAALPYYLAAGLNLLGMGILRSIQAAQAIGFLLAGLGAYGLARRLGARGPAALLAAAAYTYAPFHLVNVYIRGDSLSEFFAMGLFPWLLWAALALVRRPSAGKVAWLGGCYGLLLLTHNISALIFSPLLGLWILAEALGQPAGRRWRALGLGVAGIGFGLLLSAWFWVPALREQPLVQLGEQTTGYFHYPGHFRSADLVQRLLTHDYTIDAERNPFSMGLVQAVLAVVALGLAAWRTVRERNLAPQRLLLACGLVGYTFLITPWSRPIWDHVPLLPYVQFPWRMLSVQALCIALLAADGLGALARRWMAGALALLLAGLCAVSGLAGLRVDRLPLDEGDITVQRLMLYETYSGNIGSTVRYEYLPAAMVPRPQVSARQLAGGERPAPLTLEGALSSARLLGARPEEETWDLVVAEPALLAFQTAFYPGWQATVDGVAQGVQPVDGLGLVGLRLGAGTHRVTLRYAGTRTQRYARWASLGGLALWLALALLPARRSRRYRVRAAVAGGAVVLVGLWLVLAARAPFAARTSLAARTPFAAGAEAAGAGPLVMDFARIPYLHREPQGVWLGGALLSGYTYLTGEPVPGDAWRIELAWEEGEAGDSVEVALLGVTAHLYAPSPVWASARADWAGPRQTLTLTLPGDLPPGLYVPTVRVLRDGVEQPVRAANGTAMGTPALEPVQVRAHRRSSGAEPVLGAYGPEQAPPAVALLEGAVRRAGGNRVEVSLEWRSERQASLNYALSVRLAGPDGTPLASRDLPPLLAGYPTSLWQPGELLADRVLLDVAEGLPAHGLRLEVVLYDRLTLKGAGSVALTDLDLLEPSAP